LPNEIFFSVETLANEGLNFWGGGSLIETETSPTGMSFFPNSFLKKENKSKTPNHPNSMK
jgi:hypothetical protein